MTRQELINTLKQGCRITPHLVREITHHLEAASHVEANLKFYQAEAQRLEDILAAKEG